MTWTVLAAYDGERYPTAERAEVPGGWLYRTTTYTALYRPDPYDTETRRLLAQQVTFVPLSMRSPPHEPKPARVATP